MKHHIVSHTTQKLFKPKAKSIALGVVAMIIALLSLMMVLLVIFWMVSSMVALYFAVVAATFLAHPVTADSVYEQHITYP